MDSSLEKSNECQQVYKYHLSAYHNHISWLRLWGQVYWCQQKLREDCSPGFDGMNCPRTSASFIYCKVIETYTTLSMLFNPVSENSSFAPGTFFIRANRIAINEYNFPFYTTKSLYPLTIFFGGSSSQTKYFYIHVINSFENIGLFIVFFISLGYTVIRNRTDSWPLATVLGRNASTDRFCFFIEFKLRTIQHKHPMDMISVRGNILHFHHQIPWTNWTFHCLFSSLGYTNSNRGDVWSLSVDFIFGHTRGGSLCFLFQKFHC